MAISQSDTYPETLAKSRGKTLYRYDIHEIEVADPDGSPRTAYEYNEVAIDGPVTKGKVLEAMRLAEQEQDAGDASDAAAQYTDAKSAIDLSDIAGITYAQLDTYIDNNVTDLASAKAFLKKLAKGVLAMLKRQDWG